MDIIYVVLAVPLILRRLSSSCRRWRYLYAMARVKVMYWKEIPVQIKAEDEWEEISIMLDDRFQQAVDSISMYDGSSGSEDYMAAWQWGTDIEVLGDARDAAQEVAERFNDNFPQDFVVRIRDSHSSGERDPSPGAVDHWVQDVED